MSLVVAVPLIDVMMSPGTRLAFAAGVFDWTTATPTPFAFGLTEEAISRDSATKKMTVSAKFARTPAAATRSRFRRRRRLHLDVVLLDERPDGNDAPENAERLHADPLGARDDPVRELVEHDPDNEREDPVADRDDRIDPGETERLADRRGRGRVEAQGQDRVEDEQDEDDAHRHDRERDPDVGRRRPEPSEPCPAVERRATPLGLDHQRRAQQAEPAVGADPARSIQ